MTRSLEPESLDLAEIAAFLRGACGPTVEGPVVGRTRMRDEVVRHLRCSQLEGETVVDTMVGRGFLLQRARPDGLIEWVIVVP